MRAAVLACIAAATLGVAAADEPNKPPGSDPATTAQPASPAAAPKPPQSPAAPTAAAAQSVGEDQLDKHFRAEGYSVQTRNGEKVYCKRKDVVGSRLSGGVMCMNGQELLMRERKDQEDLDKAQRIMGHPEG